MQITTILQDAVLRQATDIHIVTGLPVMLRVAGELVPANDVILTPKSTKEICYSLLSEEEVEVFEKELDLDLIKTFGKIRFRINLSFSKNSIGAAIRILNYSPIPLEDLNLPVIVTKMCYRDKGLILLTGTTSQGKTTTLSGMIDCINRHRNKHIITIEDPIEMASEACY